MKIKYYILSLFLLICFGLNVNAASISIDNVKTVNSDTTADITLHDSNSSISKIVFNIEPSDTSIATISKGDSISSITFDIGGTEAHIFANNTSLTDGVVGHFKITNKTTTNASVNINLSNIVFTKTDGTTINGDNVTKNVSLSYAQNTSAKLSNITNNVSAALSPVFSSDTLEYKMVLKDTIPTITLNPSCEQSGCTHTTTCLSGCSIKDNSRPDRLTLAMGKNVVTLAVTSQDNKSTKTYTLNIYRGATTDGSSYLKSLEINGFTLNEKFDKNNLDYSATVDYDHENIEILAVPEDENADVQIRGNNKLQVGNTVVTITVTSAETGEKTIYNISVTREDFKGSSTTTKALVTTNKKSHSKIWLIIIIAVIGLLIIGAAAYFIFFKGNKPKKEKITKDDKIKTDDDNEDDLSVKTNELNDDLNYREDHDKPSVDDALADLMETKELELTKELHFDNK
jgi:hypothetical protein